ncbi:hypothetical protein HPP92_001766 [Vanilla planifolia]|uniref:DNA primase n=1 Tax=Vanilla planifolia TaxID=51239 RepID=A0A835RR97_VANPL|nr:hypothetical protein HPP92_001766 [Vanilla planifolia]
MLLVELVDDKTEFLILASDGLWKVMSNQQVVDAIREINDPQVAAKHLTQEALIRKSKDDISCIAHYMMRKPIEHQIVRQSWSELRRGGSTAKSQLKLTLILSLSLSSRPLAPSLAVVSPWSLAATNPGEPRRNRALLDILLLSFLRKLNRKGSAASVSFFFFPFFGVVAIEAEITIVGDCPPFSFYLFWLFCSHFETLDGFWYKDVTGGRSPIVLLDNCFRRRSPSTQLRLTCASALSGNLFHFTSITSTCSGSLMEKDLNGAVDMQIDECGQNKHSRNQEDQDFSSEYLKVYYGKLFPYADVCRWLSYANDGKHPAQDQSYLSRREFSFTLENDIYLRFQSFKNANEMEQSVKEKCPHKIDIGPVYSIDPVKRHAYAQSGSNGFAPVERELVFDIDISEYNDVRYCCTGSDICLDCWPLMAIAIKVIDAALRDDFGFNHILWVYSGRRVCSLLGITIVKLERLSNEQRSSIADYLHVYKGSENSSKKASLTGSVLHPFLVRSYTNVLIDYFEKKLMHSQKLFSYEERYQKILGVIPDESIVTELHDKWKADRKSSSCFEENRWNQLKSLLQSRKQKVQGLRRCVEEIVFTYTYPRIDMEVSKHMNHLLKAPFCVHPKTGRVCVPIDPQHCDSFDPTAVPTLSKLLEELNTGGWKADTENGWSGTSLGESIQFFRSSFLQPLLKTCREEMESSYNAKVQSNKNSLNW